MLRRTRDKKVCISKNDKRENKLFFLYISPWLVGFIGLTIFPLMYSFILSFTDSTVGSISDFIGFHNYIQIFTKDELTIPAILNTLKYTVVFVPLSLIVSIAIAMVLNQKIRGLGFFRVAFYIPSVCAGVAITLLWGWILNPNFGLLNYGLSMLGIEGPGWLSDPKWAMISIIIMNLWTQGNMIIIFLAGLQDIPEALMESARIDGAGFIKRTVAITLPMLTPTIFFNLILGIIAAFQMFNQPYILTTGGPKNSTYVYMLHVFNNAFKYGNIGYACALAWIMLLFVFSITLIIMKTSRKWVFYSDN